MGNEHNLGVGTTSNPVFRTQAESESRGASEPRKWTRFEGDRDTLGLKWIGIGFCALAGAVCVHALLQNNHATRIYRDLS